MDRNYGKPIISLSSPSAIALWKGEILGQLSDGMWENTAPHDHWQFWHDCTVTLSPVNGHWVDLGDPMKTGYNIAGLIEYVGDRMLKICAFGYANPQIVLASDLGGCVLDQLPETLQEYETTQVDPQLPEWRKRFFDIVTKDAFIVYLNYKHLYTMKSLRADIKVIKTAMKTCLGCVPRP